MRHTYPPATSSSQMHKEMRDDDNNSVCSSFVSFVIASDSIWSKLGRVGRYWTIVFIRFFLCSKLMGRWAKVRRTFTTDNRMMAVLRIQWNRSLGNLKCMSQTYSYFHLVSPQVDFNSSVIHPPPNRETGSWFVSDTSNYAVVNDDKKSSWFDSTSRGNKFSNSTGERHRKLQNFFFPSLFQEAARIRSKECSASSGIIPPRFSHDNSTIKSCNLIIGDIWSRPGRWCRSSPLLSFMFRAVSFWCQTILDRYSIYRLDSIRYFPLHSNLYIYQVNISWYRHLLWDAPYSDVVRPFFYVRISVEVFAL